MIVLMNTMMVETYVLGIFNNAWVLGDCVCCISRLFFKML